METAEIRRRWLAFFEKNGHTVVPSAPLIHDDPNLLFVNAGMVPFKPYFLGQETPQWDRATSVQKCVRTGDIEEVGKTSRHGTFFQMNGNFSFGDYFKKDAIRLAWELLTTSQDDGGYGLDPDRLWATVYEDDDEAERLWAEYTSDPARAHRAPRQGSTTTGTWASRAPAARAARSSTTAVRSTASEGGPAVDEDRYMEIWNLVFMQYELSRGPRQGRLRHRRPAAGEEHRHRHGPRAHRVVLQGVDNLYEIDEVYPVLAKAAEMTGKSYGAHSGHAAEESHPDDVRLRVVADHIRSSLMLIGDGVTPGNEGRGYVLRRMLRRAVRSMRLLGFEEPALPHLLPISMERMKQSYPELETGFDRISQIAYAEEEAFRRTLASGTTILDTAVSRTKESGGTTLAGDQAFQLHDTYGFPIDLTLEMAQEQGLSVDREGFTRLMQEQRNRAKADAKAKKSGHANTEVWKELRGARRDRLPRVAGADERGQGHRPRHRRPARRGDRARPARPGRPRPHALLCRVRWPDRRRGHHHRRWRAPQGHGRPASGQGPHRPHRRGRPRTAAHRCARPRRGRPRVAALRRARRTPAPTSSTPRSARCSARRRCSPAPTTSPATSASTSRGDRRSRPTTRSEIEEVANLAVRKDLPVSAAWMPLAQAREARCARALR